jgi:hypothetical protein
MDLLAYLPRNLGAVLEAEKLRCAGGEAAKGSR